MTDEQVRKLQEPFPAEDIEWRVGQCGKKGDKCWAMVLAYINARAVMDRLDEVFGVAGWSDSLKQTDSGIICRLTVTTDGKWGCVTKADVCDFSDIEGFKGAASGALKRAAVKFGIGRYLYSLTDNWAKVSINGKFSGKTKDGTYFKWDPPALPSWALPTSNKAAKEKPEPVPEPEKPKSVSDVHSIKAKVVGHYERLGWAEEPEKCLKIQKGMKLSELDRGQLVSLEAWLERREPKGE